MTETDEIPDDMTEVYDADVPRLDLVGAAANGTPRFLIAKDQGGAGLFDPGYVRDLIAKSDAAAAADPREMVTMTGSPAAIAALIHNAPVRKAAPAAVAVPDEIEKAEASTQSMNDRPDSDFAYVEPGGRKDESGKTVPRSLRHFPIYDAAHVRNALNRAPQSPFGEKAMPKIRAAAKRFGIDVAKALGFPEIRTIEELRIMQRAADLGASSEIPDTWNADGTLKKEHAMAAEAASGEVVKDSLVTTGGTGEGVDGMDPAVVLAEPEGEQPGDPQEPASPAWEAIDAATARKWTAIAVRLRNALSVMADRELLEAATADPADAEAAFDLQDAQCCLDCVIDTLAGFAVEEQAEADLAGEAMDAIGKALRAFDPAPLDTVESLAAVRKAGRTLSAANEQSLRAAISALQQILASLPKAPDAPTGGQMVAKTANEEPDMATPTPSEQTTAASGQQPAMGAASPDPKPVAGAVVTDETKDAAPVAKAGKAPQMPVFDAKGNLVGVVDPAEVTRLAMPDGDTTGDDEPEQSAAPTGQDTADAPPTDLTPAPAASVGTPADAAPADDENLAKATDPTDTEAPQDVLKGSITQLVKAALDEHGAAQGELIKSLEDRNRVLEERNEALAKQAATLEERLTRVENQPAVMAIASNGAVPPAHLMRGQDHGARVEVTKAEQLRTAFTASDDARQQKVLAEDLNALAIEKLREIHAAGPR